MPLHDIGVVSKIPAKDLPRGNRAGILAPGFATLLSAGWDFFAYRFIIFKKPTV